MREWGRSGVFTDTPISRLILRQNNIATRAQWRITPKISLKVFFGVLKVVKTVKLIKMILNAKILCNSIKDSKSINNRQIFVFYQYLQLL